MNINATKAVLKIVDDIKDRRGFKQLWDDLDDDIKQEIMEKWFDIVNEAIKASR